MKNPKFVLLDVRSISENFLQRIPNSVLIPVSNIEDKLEELGKDKIYLIYCRSGVRSVTAAGVL
jgi:phage shock protein E